MSGGVVLVFLCLITQIPTQKHGWWGTELPIRKTYTYERCRTLVEPVSLERRRAEVFCEYVPRTGFSYLLFLIKSIWITTVKSTMDLGVPICHPPPPRPRKTIQMFFIFVLILTLFELRFQNSNQSGKWCLCFVRGSHPRKLIARLSDALWSTSYQTSQSGYQALLAVAHHEKWTYTLLLYRKNTAEQLSVGVEIWDWGRRWEALRRGWRGDRKRCTARRGGDGIQQPRRVWLPPRLAGPVSGAVGQAAEPSVSTHLVFPWLSLPSWIGYPMPHAQASYPGFGTPQDLTPRCITLLSSLNV